MVGRIYPPAPLDYADERKFFQGLELFAPIFPTIGNFPSKDKCDRLHLVEQEMQNDSSYGSGL